MNLRTECPRRDVLHETQIDECFQRIVKYWFARYKTKVQEQYNKYCKAPLKILGTFKNTPPVNLRSKIIKFFSFLLKNSQHPAKLFLNCNFFLRQVSDLSVFLRKVHSKLVNLHQIKHIILLPV